MGWQDRNVYFRDFAYTARRRARMATGNISEVPANVFAEYVEPFPTPGLLLHDALHDSASCEGESRASGDAPDGDAPLPDEAVAVAVAVAVDVASRCARCPPVRPLVHRLDSHRVFVRALAKLQSDRLLSGPMLDVYVGETKRHWSLHRNLLLHHSERLEEELHDSNGKKLHELDLRDYDPAGFELLVKWLYQGRLDDVSDMADANQKYDYAVSCHKLYLLCSRFDMPQLKNVAMDQYRKGLNEAELVPDADEIDDIYRKSPDESPFRRLMTRIAARQIMDPGNDRDVETYRQCFENNPDFAVDLVKAIKHGAGGILFEDPTDHGNGCEYHDHEAGPNCHIKGKGKSKQALKASASAHPRDPKYVKSEVSANSVLPLRRRPPPPLLQNPPPPPPPRQAHRQDGISVGPLRRRLTSPASSTVETSTETATARLPSPKEQRDKFRRVTPPERRLQSPTLLEERMESHQAPVARPPSSDGTSRQPQDSSVSGTDKGAPSVASPKSEEQTSPARGIWRWAKAGTGRLGMIGRIPHPEWKGPVMTSKAATSAVNGALEGGRLEDSLDDFSIPSSVATEPGTEEAAAAQLEGLGISNVLVDPSFSQTKRSSDDLVAAMNGTPSPPRGEEWTNGDDGTIPNVSIPSSNNSPPTSPSPAQRTKKEPLINGAKDKPSPHRIPTYKIALSANILSPSKTRTASTST